MTQISALTAGSAIVGTEEIPGSDGTATTKAWTFNQVLAFMQSKGAQRVYRLNADHAISTVAATEVTAWRTPGGGADVAVTLPIGTHAFIYYLIIQSISTSVSPLYGINFTGTAPNPLFGIRYWDSGPMTAGTGTADNTNASTGATAVGPISGQVHNAYSTTTGVMAHVGGVGAGTSNILVLLEGIIIVTAQGDLELWHGSETASSTTIKAGSSLIVTQTA